MQTKKIATTLALLVGLSTVALQPASAQSDLNRILDALGVRGGGGGSSGFAADQARIRTNITTGLNNIATQISAGITSGQLTIDEQATLNAEFNRVRIMNDSFMADGGYTNAEVSEILAAFSSMNTMISANLNNGLNIGVLNPGTGLGGLPVTDYNSVISLRNSIRASIDDGVDDGTLTSAEAAQLRSDLNRISAQINRRTVRGNLNLNPVVRRLIALEQRVDRLTTDNSFAGYGNWWY